MAKKLNQQDLLKLTSIGTPPTDSVAFAAKSDGLYQKVGTTESKLSTTAELLDRVKTPVPANAKFTDTNTVYTHPSTPGNKHIPSGGAAGQFLKWSASGVAVWAADNDTKYTAGTNIQISGTNVISATNTNTTYSAGSGLTLSGTQFSLPVTVTGDGTFVKSVTQGADGVSVTLGTPPNTNTTYSTGTLVQLKAGTDTTGRLQTAKLLNEWLTEKGYITSYVDTKYTAGTNIQISEANVISATDTKYSLPTASGTTLGGVKIGSNISITSGVISVAAPYSHPSTHPASMITGLHASATTGVAGSVAWGNVTGKPGTFAPSTHTHSNITITAGTGLSGGGALSATRTLSIASTYAPNTSTSLGASKNLNDYRTAGFYHQTSNANATTALNYPVASAGALLVETAAGVIQTYKVYSSSNVYVRGYYDTTWTAWRKLVNASDSIPWARITGVPATATTHPTWAQVTGKPTTFAPSSHKHPTTDITGLGSIATINKNDSTANYLRGDGTWVTPPNTTYVVATTSVNGLMSSDDKTKLNGIATGANKTTLSASVTSTSATTAATSSAVKSAYDRGSTGIADAATAQARADSAYSLASGKEGKFTKNDAFNKNFGTVKGTVAQGNDSRIINGQTAYGWGNHASAGYIKSYVNTTYTAGTNVQISTDNVISATNTIYTHPTGDGNKHVPATGTTNSGKVLKAGATAGSISWGTLSYSDVGAASSGHTHTFASLTSKPTTLSGYGITDAYTKTGVDDLLSNKSDKATKITAGNGLTGGGTLAANRTITLGTPSTLTASTANEVTASSHTHAITTTSVGAANTIIQTDASGGTKLGNLMVGGNWKIEQVGTELVFKYNGVTKQRFLADGSIVAVGEVTAITG